jgi:MFS family permease
MRGDSYSVWQAWYTLLVFEIVIVASGIDIAIVTLLVHPIEAAFQMNDVGLTTITAVPVAIGVALGFYPAGLLADTFRRRDVLAAGVAIWTFGAIVAARADSGAMFFLARLLAGIGAGALSPIAVSMISDAFPRARRAFASSIFTAGGAVGTGVGLTACGALVAAAQRNGIVALGGISFSPWQQCFVAIAAMGLIAVALALTVPEPTRKELSTLTKVDLRSTLRIFGKYISRHRLLWGLLLIGYAIGLTSADSVFYWAPTFGMRHYGNAEGSGIALLGAFTAGAALIGSIGFGLLGQRGINHSDPGIVPRMLVVLAVVSCVSVVCFPFMPSWLLAVIGIAAIKGALSATIVLVFVAVQDTAPNEVRGQLVGMIGILVLVPSMISSTLVAFIASNLFAKSGGLGPAMALVGGVTSLLAIMLYTFAGGPYERARDEMRAVASLQVR